MEFLVRPDTCFSATYVRNKDLYTSHNSSSIHGMNVEEDVVRTEEEEGRSNLNS